MPNPFMTSSVSLEDTAAFSDELTQDAQKKEEHYLKGYSSNDPAIVETNKMQDNASAEVETQLEVLDENLTQQVATESVESNPFIEQAAPSTEEPVAVETPNDGSNPFEGVVENADAAATAEAEQDNQLNPFFNTVAGDVPAEVDVSGDEKTDLKGAVDSLESIIEDLEGVMEDSKLNARNTEFVVDVQLQDDGKALLDQDLDAAIAKAPEPMESLESIKLCDERSVPQILAILRDKVTEMKAK